MNSDWLSHVNSSEIHERDNYCRHQKIRYSKYYAATHNLTVEQRKSKEQTHSFPNIKHVNWNVAYCHDSRSILVAALAAIWQMQRLHSRLDNRMFHHPYNDLNDLVIHRAADKLVPNIMWWWWLMMINLFSLRNAVHYIDVCIRYQ